MNIVEALQACIAHIEQYTDENVDFPHELLMDAKEALEVHNRLQLDATSKLRLLTEIVKAL